MADHYLSPWLDDQIRDGRAILFLGAGAIYGAVGKNGEIALTGNQLRDRLCDAFLGGQLKNRPLAQVAEYSQNQSSLIDVQQYVHELFAGLEPAPFHLLIPSFRWHAIITTNYDYVLERAYSSAEGPLQEPISIVKNGDASTDVLGEATRVPFLKLHGCLSRISDTELPLILSSEQYAKYALNRERLFATFKEWARTHPIIFCGYDIGDPNLQQILFDLGDKSINRPRYAVINPSLTDLDISYWSSRRFEPKKVTFEEFLTSINNRIPPDKRQLSVLLKPDASSIQRRIVRGTPSPALLSYLDQELIHVHDGLVFPSVDPKQFYRGAGNDWDAIASNFDVPRRITDEILFDTILNAPEDKRTQVFLVTVTGPVKRVQFQC